MGVLGETVLFSTQHWYSVSAGTQTGVLVLGLSESGVGAPLTEIQV